MGKWLALAVTFFIAAVLGVSAARPPAPLPATAPADQFATGRAMADLRVIAKQPHSTGSAANDTVRVYLVSRLQSLGFTVRTATAPLSDKDRARIRKWGSPYADTAIATNIIALRPGRDPASNAVAVMAHYDSVWASPGAADDAAGVASALEIARAIPRQNQARDLVILLTDAEEVGLVGARGFFAAGSEGDPLAGRIGALVNLETRGGGGRAMMFETGADNGELVRLFADQVGNPAANSLAVKIYELLPNSTDFTPAKKRGITGFNFAFMGRASLYHSPLATPDAIEQGSLQHLGAQALDITRALVTAPVLPAAAPDLMFSDVFGRFIIAYPADFGWLIIGVTGVLITGYAMRHARQWGRRSLATGLLDGVTFTFAAGILLYAGNLLSGADAKINYYDRLAALPRLEVQALLLMLAALALGLGIAGAKRTLWGGWLGLALLNLVLVVAAQLFLPAGAPVLAWPLLVAALAMLPAALSRSDTPGPLARGLAAIAAIFGLAFAGGVAHFALLAIGGPTPSAIAVFAPLVLLLLWPLLPPIQRRTAFTAALAFIVLAGAIALWVRLDSLAPTVPPYVDGKARAATDHKR
jgi:hypothetical protein